MDHRLAALLMRLPLVVSERGLLELQPRVLLTRLVLVSLLQATEAAAEEGQTGVVWPVALAVQEVCMAEVAVAAEAGLLSVVVLLVVLVALAPMAA